MPAADSLFVTTLYRVLLLLLLPLSFFYLLFSLWDWHSFNKWIVPVLLLLDWALLLWLHTAAFRRSGYLFFPAPRIWWDTWPIRTRIPLFLATGALLIASLPLSFFPPFLLACLLQFYLLSTLSTAWIPRTTAQSWSRRRTLGVCALSVLSVLMLAEAMNRTSWFGLFRPDPLVGVALRHNDWYGVNRDGFRGPLPAPAPAPSVRRILFLGDSSTFGIGAPAEQTFAQLTVECLNLSEPGKYEAINGGMPGHNLAQNEAIWRRLKRYQPAQVVLMAGYHHLSLRRFVTRQRETDRWGERWRRALPLFDKFDLTLPTTVGMFAMAWQVWGGDEKDQAANQALFKEYLEKLIAETAAAGAPLLLLPCPSRQVDQTIVELMAATAAAHETPVLDLRADFIDATPPLLMRDGLHPNRDGHQVLATALCRYFQEHPIR